MEGERCQGRSEPKPAKCCSGLGNMVMTSQCCRERRENSLGAEKEVGINIHNIINRITKEERENEKDIFDICA